MIFIVTENLFQGVDSYIIALEYNIMDIGTMFATCFPAENEPD
jgi:hypothetical protein